MRFHDRAAPLRSLLVDFLRAHRPNAVPVRVLVELGALFGATQNAVRVATSRLVADGKLESDERGLYRLARRTDLISDHIDEWRLGEQRRRPWNGQWFAIVLPRGADRAERRRSLIALESFGFRRTLDATYIRPHNLVLSVPVLLERLGTFGLEAAAASLVMSEVDASTERLIKNAWDIEVLTAEYQARLQALTQSAARIEELAIEQALIETFQSGGDAIRVLATDPLLPDEMMAVDDRAVLHRAMLAYDVIGRRLWLQWIADIESRAGAVRDSPFESLAS